MAAELIPVETRAQDHTFVARGKAFTFQADVWLNLTTLARLVREATAATGA